MPDVHIIMSFLSCVSQLCLPAVSSPCMCCSEFHGQRFYVRKLDARTGGQGKHGGSATLALYRLTFIFFVFFFFLAAMIWKTKLLLSFFNNCYGKSFVGKYLNTHTYTKYKRESRTSVIPSLPVQFSHLYREKTLKVYTCSSDFLLCK